MTQVEQDAPVQSAAHSPGPRSRCGGRPGRSCCWCRSQTPQRDSPRRCPSRHGACPVHARQWSDGCDGTVPDEGFSTRSNCAGSQLILVVEGDGRVTRRRALGRTKHTRSPKPNPHPCPLVGGRKQTLDPAVRAPSHASGCAQAVGSRPSSGMDHAPGACSIARAWCSSHMHVCRAAAWWLLLGQVDLHAWWATGVQGCQLIHVFTGPVGGNLQNVQTQEFFQALQDFTRVTAHVTDSFSNVVWRVLGPWTHGLLCEMCVTDPCTPHRMLARRNGQDARNMGATGSA